MKAAAGGAEGRARAIQDITEIFSAWGAGERDELTRLFEKALAQFPDRAFEDFSERLETTGEDWGYQAPDPVARHLSRLVHSLVARDDSELQDEGCLAVARERPVVFLGNHLSFIDANTVDFLLARAGWEDVADRLSVLVGPKVFELPIRRLASLCFGSIKMPQSTSRASGAAVMSRRETLRLANQTLSAVYERRAAGDHVLIFPEGSRSRSGSMQRVLPAVARYVEQPFATIVPFALWGTEKIVPIEEDRAYVNPVHVRIGRSLEASRLFEQGAGRRALIADAIGYRIADLLPPGYRGFYTEVPQALAAARELASSS